MIGWVGFDKLVGWLHTPKHNRMFYASMSYSFETLNVCVVISIMNIGTT